VALIRGSNRLNAKGPLQGGPFACRTETDYQPQPQPQRGPKPNPTEKTGAG